MNLGVQHPAATKYTKELVEKIGANRDRRKYGNR